MPVQSSVAAPQNRAKLVMSTKGQSRHTIKYAASACGVSVADIWKLIPSANLFSWDVEAKQYYILVSDMPALKEKLAERAPGPVTIKTVSTTTNPDTPITRNEIAERLRQDGFKVDFQRLSKIDREGKWPAGFAPLGKRKVGNTHYSAWVYNPAVVNELKAVLSLRQLNANGGHKKKTNPTPKAKMSAKVMHHTSSEPTPMPDLSTVFNRLINEPKPEFETRPSATIVTHNKAAYVSLNDLAADLIISGHEKAGVYLLTKYNPKV